MNTWEAHLLIAQKYMKRNLTITIKSQPPFLLEFFLVLLYVTILIYLTLELMRSQRQLRNFIKPNSVQFKQSEGHFNEIISATSLKTSLVRCEFLNKRGRRRRTLSKMSWLSANRNDFAELFTDGFHLSDNASRRRLFVDKLTALTPTQFVRLDKEEQLRNMQTIGCMRSLTTLFNNVVHKRFDEPQLREQLDAAKEDCRCSAVTHQLIQYLDSERVTDSLIDVLNEIIEDTNAENPLPMNGEFTALVYDIGNLKDRAATLFDRGFDFTDSSSASSTATSASSEMAIKT